MNSDVNFNDCVKQYLREIGYMNIEVLGSGGFGDVLAAISPEKKEVAVKIIANESSWPLEEYMWPLLKHPNILPILDVMNVDDLDCKLYVTPKHPATLVKTIREPDFKYDPDAFERIKKYFVDVLMALNNMHELEFCHLDLKSDNVLVSSEDSAIVCDFSGANFTGINIERLVAPATYRPPECYSVNRGVNIEGIHHDMWSFGLVVLNCLTEFWPSRHMNNMHPNWRWEKEVKPVILMSLEEEFFIQLLDKAFPFVLISKRDSSNALDFVKLLLSIDPQRRPTASEALKHPFLKEAHLSRKERLEFNKLERGAVFKQEDNVFHPLSEKEQKKFNDVEVKPVKGFGENEKSSSDVEVTSVYPCGKDHLEFDKVEREAAAKEEENVFHPLSGKITRKRKREQIVAGDEKRPPDVLSSLLSENFASFGKKVNFNKKMVNESKDSLVQRIAGKRKRNENLSRVKICRHKEMVSIYSKEN